VQGLFVRYAWNGNLKIPAPPRLRLLALRWSIGHSFIADPNAIAGNAIVYARGVNVHICAGSDLYANEHRVGVEPSRPINDVVWRLTSDHGAVNYAKNRLFCA